jgi:hypothetical protein
MTPETILEKNISYPCVDSSAQSFDIALKLNFEIRVAMTEVFNIVNKRFDIPCPPDVGFGMQESFDNFSIKISFSKNSLAGNSTMDVSIKIEMLSPLSRPTSGSIVCSNPLVSNHPLFPSIDTLIEKYETACGRFLIIHSICVDLD